jgi:hypothetical protein
VTAAALGASERVEHIFSHTHTSLLLLVPRTVKKIMLRTNSDINIS